MKQKNWTMKEQEKLVKMYADENRPIVDIAKELGRTEESILGKAVRLKLNRRRKHFEIYRGYELLAEGTAKECAEKLGKSENTIYTYHHRTKNSKYKDLDKSILAYVFED